MWVKSHESCCIKENNFKQIRYYKKCYQFLDDARWNYELVVKFPNLWSATRILAISAAILYDVI